MAGERASADAPHLLRSLGAPHLGRHRRELFRGALGRVCGRGLGLSLWPCLRAKNKRTPQQKVVNRTLLLFVFEVHFLALHNFTLLGHFLWTSRGPILATNAYILISWAALFLETAALRWLLIAGTFAAYGWASRSVANGEPCMGMCQHRRTPKGPKWWFPVGFPSYLPKGYLQNNDQAHVRRRGPC